MNKNRRVCTLKQGIPKQQGIETLVFLKDLRLVL